MNQTTYSLKEWRKSLVQHLFHYYGELKKGQSEQEAKKLVLDEIDELKKAFGGESSSISFFNNLIMEEQVWLDQNKKAVQEKNIEQQFYTEEVLNAFKVLRIALKERENGHQ